MTAPLGSCVTCVVDRESIVWAEWTERTEGIPALPNSCELKLVHHYSVAQLYGNNFANEFQPATGIVKIKRREKKRKSQFSKEPDT